MNAEPVFNDYNNPLISILIYNYSGVYLRRCLESIFEQNILTNIEIILIDNATLDDSWDIALEFAEKYPKIITVSRNKRSHSLEFSRKHCFRMAKGAYCALLSGETVFLPEYINNCVKVLKTDPYAKFDLVERKPQLNIEPPNISDVPLVSILCYNYNYGRYLRQALESAFSQTYENIEVCFSDNASDDESWAIALEFAKKYPGKMRITRNRMNFGPDYNFANCYSMKFGNYYINFCSDDVLAPDYVERCVNILENNPNTGLVIVNRSIIDENGNITEEAPFYNQSCIIPGEEQAAVYMMAGINPSVSQIMYRSELCDSRTITGALVARYYGTRILDFNIALDFDIGYIKEPLLYHRIHGQSDTSQADANLMPIIGLYVLNHQFADIASTRGIKKVTDRLQPSIEKLAGLSVRYCVRSLLGGNEYAALRYFHLAAAFNTQITEDTIYKKLYGYWDADTQAKQAIIEEITKSDNLAARNFSYNPPLGSIPL